MKGKMAGILAGVLMGGSLYAATGDYTLSFLAGDSTADTLPGENGLELRLDAFRGQVDVLNSGNAARLTRCVGLVGTQSMHASFSMILTAGFAFNPAEPSYDQTAYSDPEKSVIRIRHNKGEPDGVAALGMGSGFGAGVEGRGEMLAFTIQGLGAGQRLVLLGYAMKEGDPERTGFYYGEELKRVATTGTDMDLSSMNIALGNGDRFGFGYEHGSGNRSALREIRFRLVSASEGPLGLLTQ